MNKKFIVPAFVIIILSACVMAYPPACDGFTACGLETGVAASGFTVSALDKTDQTEPTIAQAIASTKCSAGCVAAEEFTDVCQNLYDFFFHSDKNISVSLPLETGKK